MSLYEIKQAGVPNVSFVLHEETSRYSRDVAVVPANTPALAAGTVLGKVTASGKMGEDLRVPPTIIALPGAAGCSADPTNSLIAARRVSQC